MIHWPLLTIDNYIAPFLINLEQTGNTHRLEIHVFIEGLVRTGGSNCDYGLVIMLTSTDAYVKAHPFVEITAAISDTV